MIKQARAAERKAVMQALLNCNGNRTKAAVVLGMHRRTIFDRINIYEQEILNSEDFKRWDESH